MTIGGDVLYTGGSDNSIQMWSILVSVLILFIDTSNDNRWGCAIYRW